MSGFKNPIATFIPATHNVPTTDRTVFVIAEDGTMGTGSYHRRNGKGEWLVSFQDDEYRQPVWWAYKPDTSEDATGYKFDPAMVLTC